MAPPDPGQLLPIQTQGLEPPPALRYQPLQIVLVP
jgi:hypothetical protein